jgi:hypothetical protein
MLQKVKVRDVVYGGALKRGILSTDEGEGSQMEKLFFIQRKTHDEQL